MRRRRIRRRGRTQAGRGRNVRRFRRRERNSMMKFTAVIGIILIAVACGYGTARFVLAPVLGYDTEVLKLDFPSKITSAVSSALSGEKKEDSGSYALQFGVFSQKDGAEELRKELEKQGIETLVKEEDGRFKVLSPLISGKKNALGKLKEIKTGSDIDVFVTDAE